MSALKSAIEIVLADCSPIDSHPVPPITHPLGKHWNQPDRHRIEIDATHALMSRKDFEALPTYSTSTPTGVYPGKMWKRQKFNSQSVTGQIQWLDSWWLCWYGFSDKGEDFCSNNHRDILIV